MKAVLFNTKRCFLWLNNFRSGKQLQKASIIKDEGLGYQFLKENFK
jgi:hypothetical protein